MTFVIVGVAFWLATAARAEPFTVPTPFTLTLPPTAAPNLALRNDDDEKIELATFRGRYVLLSFWATWCGPCIEEMPSLNNLQGELGGRRFQVVPVSVEGRFQLTRIDMFMRGYRLSKLPVYALDQKTDQRVFGIQAIPTTLLIDPNGKELWRAHGPVDWNADAARTMITHFIDAAQ